MFASSARRLLLVAACLVSMVVSTVAGPLTALVEEPLPLAEYGPFGIGLAPMFFVDETRDDRQVRVDVWYPALVSEADREAGYAPRNVVPDLSDAPYPLVLATYPYGNRSLYWGWEVYGDWAGHLASHGFVVVAVEHFRRGPYMWRSFVHSPQDVLLVLDQLAAGVEGELAGVYDAERVGIWSLGDGAVPSLAVGEGVPIDLEHLKAYCSEIENVPGHVHPCHAVQNWDLLAQDAEGANLSVEVPWPSFEGDRVMAVVAIAPWGGPLFSEEGLAAGTVPALIMGGGRDVISEYERDAAYIHNHLGAEDNLLITLADRNHTDFLTPAVTPTVIHFSTAFFGKHLQGRQDYDEYLTQDYVEQMDELTWGVYEEE